MKIPLLFRPYTEDIDNIDDTFYFTKSDGTVEDGGRISGYSENELVKPIIDEDGYFVWHDPELNEMGRVLVRSSRVYDESVNTVENFGLYTGFEETDHILTLIQTPGVIFSERHAICHGNSATSDRLNMVFIDGSVGFGHGIHSSYGIAGCLGWSNTETVFNGAGSYVQHVFPKPLKIEGILLGRPSGRTNTRIGLYYTLDGINWIFHGEPPTPIVSVGNFSDIDFEGPSDLTTGWYKFTSPLICRGFRAVALSFTTWQSLRLFLPIVKVQEKSLLRTHTYENVLFNPEAFKLTEDDIALTFSSKASALESREYFSVESLEKMVVREFRGQSLLEQKPFIEFPDDGFVIGNKKSTLQHVYGGGAITLPKGDYIIEVELETYCSDFRTESTYHARQELSNVMSLTINDALTNNPLTPSQYIRSGHYTQNAFSIDITATPDHANKVFLISADLPHSSMQYDGGLAYGGTGTTIIYDLKKPRKVIGVAVCSSWNYQAGAFNCDVYNVEGEEERVIDNATVNRVAYQWQAPYMFSEPKTIRYMRFTNPEWIASSAYAGYGKLIPIFADEEYPFLDSARKLVFEVSVNDNQPIVVAHKVGKGTYRSGRITIKQLPSKSRQDMIRNSQFPLPQIVPFTTTSSSITEKVGSIVNYFANPNTKLVAQFNSSFRLWRRGVASKETENSHLNIIRLPDMVNMTDKHRFIGVSQPYPLNDLMEDKVKTKLDTSNLGSSSIAIDKLLFDTNEQTVWQSVKSEVAAGTGWFEVIIDLDKVQGIQGLYITRGIVDLSDTGYRTPAIVKLEKWNTSTETWEPLMTVLDTDLDGNGNAPFQPANLAECIRQYYPIPSQSENVGKRFKISLQGPYRDNFTNNGLRLNEVGIYSSELANKGDFKYHKSFSERMSGMNDLKPFTDYMEPGLYMFYTDGVRRDDVWFVEALTGYREITPDSTTLHKNEGHALSYNGDLRVLSDGRFDTTIETYPTFEGYDYTEIGTRFGLVPTGTTRVDGFFIHLIDDPMYILPDVIEVVEVPSMRTWTFDTNSPDVKGNTLQKGKKMFYKLPEAIDTQVMRIILRNNTPPPDGVKMGLHELGLYRNAIGE